MGSHLIKPRSAHQAGPFPQKQGRGRHDLSGTSGAAPMVAGSAAAQAGLSDRPLELRNPGEHG
jgi:hypothetical protein